MQKAKRNGRKMIPLIFSAIFAAAIAVMPIGGARAQGQQIRAESLIKGTLTVVPGELKTVSFKVMNFGASAAGLKALVGAPAGWQSVISPENFELAPGESRTVFVTLGVREYEKAGGYDVDFSLQSDGAILARTLVRVEVEAVSALKLVSLPSNPLEVAAREDYTLGFSLTNGGNAPVEVSLSAESGMSWRLSVLPAAVDLEPGDTAGVQVTVQVPRKLPEAANHRVTLAAEARTSGAGVAGGVKERVTASATTRVIPVTLEKTMYATLDGAARLLGEWQDSGTGAGQISLELGGDLGGGRRGDLIAIAPLTGGDSGGSSRTLLSSRTIITAMYSDESWGKVAVGDITVGTVSPLLKQNLSGRGIEAFLDLDAFGVRAFISRTTGTLVTTETKGVQVEKNFGESVQAKISAMQSDDVSAQENYTRPLESMTAYSAYLQFDPSAKLHLEAESAVSHDGPAGSDGSYRVLAKYGDSGIIAAAELIHAGSNFIGAWRDVEIKRGNFSYQIAKELNIWGNMTDSRRNVDGDPELPASNEEGFAIGVSAGLGGIGKLRLTYREDDRRDANLNSFDTQSKTAEYELSKSWGGTRIAVAYRDRERTDNISGEIEDSQSIRIFGGTKIKNKTSLNFSVTKTKEGTGTESGNTTQITLGSSSKLSKSMDLSVDYQRNEHPNIGATTWTNATVTARMDNGSAVNLRIRHATGAFRDETTVGLELVYPLGIPVKSVAKGGRIVGRIFYEHNPDTGVKDAVIGVAGMQVITDETGAFAFPLVPEGEHGLTVTMAPGGVGLVPNVQMPMIVAVMTGETLELEVPVVRSGSVEGTVTAEKKRLGGPIEHIPAADIVLELEPLFVDSAAGGESEGAGKQLRKQFRLTDTRGRFMFSGLAPGEYAVRVWQEGLPKYTEAIPKELRIRIEPGESIQSADFVIKPVQRDIEITVG